MNFSGYDQESLLVIMAGGLLILTVFRILFTRRPKTDHLLYERIVALESKVEYELKAIHRRLDLLDKHLEFTEIVSEEETPPP